VPGGNMGRLDRGKTPQILQRGWCPGEDSNFHDLSATGT
jgi:hypothetical protein